MTFAPGNSASSYLSPEFDLPTNPEMQRDFINKRERLTASIINIKENAQFEKRELISAQQWFSTTINNNIRPSYGYRITFDLVALNGAAIPLYATTLTLTPTTEPPTINIQTSIIPVDGYGAATSATTFYFINDPALYIRTNVWSNASQTIIIQNDTGEVLTQCYWVFEYLYS